LYTKKWCESRMFCSKVLVRCIPNSTMSLPPSFEYITLFKLTFVSSRRQKYILNESPSLKLTDPYP
jgi:hypothetical protein